MTIKDIAKQCSVSVSTVSRVLNDRPDVSEDVRRKVLSSRIATTFPTTAPAIWYAPSPTLSVW